MSKSVGRVLLGAIALLGPVVVTGSADAGKPTPPPSTATVSWNGNGTNTRSGSRQLNTIDCDSESTPWLLWVLSSSKASSATLTIPGTRTSLSESGISMGKPLVDKKSGFSTFKYRWYAPRRINLDRLLGAPVTVTYNDAANRAVLTVGQGCTGPAGPGCDSAPVPLDQRVLANKPSFSLSGTVLTATSGSWGDVPNCTNTYTYEFIGDGYTSGAGDRNTLDTATATGIPASVMVEVVATNEYDSTSITSSYGSTLPPNAPPTGSASVGSPDTSTGEVDGSITGADEDSDTLSYETTIEPTLGTVVLDGSTGAFTYTPSATARHGALGAGPTTDTFTVTISDGHGGSVDVGVTVTIAPANAVPTGSASVGSPSATSGVVTGTIYGLDGDGDTLGYELTTEPDLGAVSLDAGTGAFTYTPTSAARHDAAGEGPTTDTFTVTVTDVYGGSVDVEVTVAISPTNFEPTASYSAGAPSGTAGAVAGSVTGSDGDGDTLTYEVATGPDLGAVVLDADTGAFTYTPTSADRHDAAGGGPTTDTFTVTVSDGYGGSVDLDVDVTISPANVEPTGSASVGSPDASTGEVDGSVTGSDGDSDTLSYAVSTGPDLGTVVLDGSTGDFTYTPTLEARHDAAGAGPTTDTFTVTISDGYGGSVDVEVTVPISPANAEPTASYSVGDPSGAAGAVTGSVSGADGDSDTLTYSLSTGPDLGVVVLDGSTGGFTYTPTADARHDAAGGGPTTDTFTVTVTDGYGGSVDVDVTVAVSPANLVPTASYSAGAPSGTAGAVAGSVTGSDGDSDTLAYSLSTGPDLGSVVLDADTGAFTYTPTSAARHDAAAGGPTTDTFTVTVSDGYGGSVDLDVDVTISPFNADPTGSASVGSPDPSTGEVDGSVSGADGDSDTLTYSLSTGPDLGVVVLDGSTGGFTYTPTREARHDAAGGGATTDTFTVIVTDGHGGSVDVDVTVTISPANFEPTASYSAGAPSADDGAVDGSVSGADGDSDTLSYALATGPDLGSVVLDADTGAFTYTPTSAARHDAAGGGPAVDTFTVTITDGHGGSVDLDVDVTIPPFNADPTASATVGTPDEATAEVLGTIVGADSDGDTLTYTTTTPPTLGTVDLDSTTGAFSYVPTAAARQAAGAGGTATDSFVVTVSDGYGGSVDLVVTVDIAPPDNVAPTATDIVDTPDASTGAVLGSVVGSDENGDTLEYTLATGPLGGAVVLDSSTGGFTYTPTATARHGAAAGGSTTDTFTVTVSDGRGGTVDHLVTVTISPANAAPTATDSINAPDASTGVVTGAVVGSDSDGDSVTYAVETAPSYGTLSLNPADGTFSYTPTATARHNAAGSGATTDSFTVTVSDGVGGSVDKQVTVSILPANSAPTATVATGTKDATTDVVQAAVVGSDADGDTLSYTTKTAPTYGTLTLSADGSFTYTPDASARHAAAAVTSPGPTSDSFTITVSDGFGGTHDQVVNVTFSAVNSVPTVTATVGSPNATTALVTGTIDVSDADTTATYTETFTYAVKTTVALGSLTLNTSTGVFSYTPTAAARDVAGAGGATTDSFVVTVTDKHGGSVDKTVTVSIAPPVTQTIDSTSGTATLTTVGTYTDTTTGTTAAQSPTFTRSAIKLTARFPAANWTSLSVTYNNGTGDVTNTVYKSATANGSTVGAITKTTFNVVYINLNSSVSYTMTVTYSTRSSATIYIVPGI